MDKSLILKKLINGLRDELDRLSTANRTASDSATDSEFKAETKWDTGGLEASYLARGYAQQFEHLANEVSELQKVTLIHSAGQPISLGALVHCDLNGYDSYFFLLPGCGGQEIKFEGSEVTAITPNSPLGRELSGKQVGDSYRVPSGAEGRIIAIL